MSIQSTRIVFGNNSKCMLRTPWHCSLRVGLLWRRRRSVHFSIFVNRKTKCSLVDGYRRERQPLSTSDGSHFDPTTSKRRMQPCWSGICMQGIGLGRDPSFVQLSSLDVSIAPFSPSRQRLFYHRVNVFFSYSCG